ncbi:MAG: hypothetical protein HYX24_00520 [Candidatus Aenigmarchaeota archaeon]|nr:hypothetical protein [Candidatus Aenigmarchaeota archaeon]
MKTAIIFLVIGAFLVNMAAADERPGYIFYMEFSANRSEDIGMKVLKIEEGQKDFQEVEDKDEKYLAKIIDVKGKAIYTFIFNITWVSHGMGKDPETGEIIDIEFVKNISEQNIRLPYYTEADKIELYHNDKRIFSRDVRPLTCKKNNRCEGDEDITNCPEDCKPKAVSTPAKTTDGKPPVETKQEFPWLLLGVFVALVAILAFLVMRRGRKSEEMGLDSSFPVSIA